MAIQKKSLIDSRTATKKALVASRPAANRPDASRPVAERAKSFKRPSPVTVVAQRRLK